MLRVAMDLSLDSLLSVIGVQAGSTLLNDLVSYWSLDEPAGTRYDSVGTNHLTQNGGALGGPVSRLGAASFVAANSDGLTKSGYSGINFSQDYTIAAWLNSSVQAGTYYVLGAQDGALNPNAPILLWTNATNSWTLDSGGGIVSAQVPMAGWHFIVGWTSGSTVNLQVYGPGWGGDEDQVFSAAYTPVGANAGNFCVGSYEYNGVSFSSYTGSIGPVGLWQRALSPAERDALNNSRKSALVYTDLTAGLKTGLVSWWDLSEGAGQVRSDSHGTNHLTPNGTAAPKVGYVRPNGVRKNAAKFVGANSEYLSGAVINPVGSFYTAGWVKASNVSSLQQAWGTMNGAGNYGWGMDLYGGNLYLQVAANSGLEYQIASIVGQEDRWMFLEGWFESGIGVRVAVNGVTSVLSAGAGATVVTGIAGTNFGTYSDPNVYLDGSAQSIGFWSRVLTAGERTTLFNKGRYALSYTEALAADANLATGLVSWWDLDEASGTRADKHGTNHLTDNATVMSAEGNGLATENAGIFDTTGSQYLSTATQVLPINGTFTVSFWAKHNDVNGGPNTYYYPFRSKASGTDQHGIFLEGSYSGWNRLYNRAGYGTYTQLDDNQNKWVLYVYEYNHSTTTTRSMAIGSLAASGVWSADSVADLGAQTDYFSVMHTSSGATLLVDEFAIWSRVLTADEITELYNAGRGKYYPF